MSPATPIPFVRRHLCTHETRSHRLVSVGTLMTQLLPVLMMRHRRVPRAKWQDHVTPTGKHWIEHVRGTGTPKFISQCSHNNTGPRFFRESAASKYRISIDISKLFVWDGSDPRNACPGRQHWAWYQAAESGPERHDRTRFL